MLLGCFRGAGLAVRLLHVLPPLRNLAQSLVARPPVPYEPAADDSSGPPDASPAVQVDGPPVIKRAVDGVEDVGHLVRAARHAQVGDRVALVRDVRPEASGFLQRDRGVRLQPVGGLGQIDEVVDARLEQGFRALGVHFLRRRERVAHIAVQIDRSTAQLRNPLDAPLDTANAVDPRAEVGHEALPRLLPEQPHPRVSLDCPGQHRVPDELGVDGIDVVSETEVVVETLTQVVVVPFPVPVAHAVFDAVPGAPDVHQVVAQHAGVPAVAVAPALRRVPPVPILVAHSPPAKRLPHLKAQRQVEGLLNHQFTRHTNWLPGTPRWDRGSEGSAAQPSALRNHAAAAQPSDSTSACSRTVIVACSCLSGG